MNRYSFIKPREKKLFRLDSKLWVFFLLFISFIYIVIEVIFVILIASVDSSTDSYTKLKRELDTKIYKVEENIKFVKSEEELFRRVIDRNKIVSDSLSSLFELVPDSIYLTDALIEKNRLLLKGYTPSKEVFNYLLLPPLKSIFKESKTTFFPAKNGWYRFVSESSSEEESIYEK